METRTNLSKYESMYDTFDKGHDREHMEGVRRFAVELAKKYCPKKEEIVYVSATLHDVGLSIEGRESHHLNGFKIIKKDKNIEQAYSKEDFCLILEGILEHRASVGKPKSIVAKIVSDADRAYADMKTHLKRSYDYNSQKYPKLTHNEVLNKVAEYMIPKFDTNGTGTRLYFDESKERILGKGKDILKVFKKRNYKEIDKILNL